MAEGMPGLAATDKGFKLVVQLAADFSIETSAEAAEYLGEHMPDAWSLDVSFDGIAPPANAGDPTRIALESPIRFQVTSEQSGSLTLIHLGSNDLLTLIYPNPAGSAPEIGASRTNGIGTEIGLVAQEPTGTEWFVFILSEQPFVPPNLAEMQHVEDWATLFPISGRGSPGESFAVWLASELDEGAVTGKVIEVEIVKQGAM
jgi:hypothetical protein